MPTATNSPPRGFLLSNKPIVLWIYDPTTSYPHDAVVNPEMFSNFRDGQLLRIHCPRVTNTQQQSQQQSQNNNSKSDQQDNKKQHDHNTPQQQHAQNQQQNQSSQSIEQSSLQAQQSQLSEKQEHNEQLESVIVKGHSVDKESLTKQPQLQLSISKDIADRFNLRSRQEVYVELIDPYQVALDHVELAFKEQYLGRSDMWRLQQNLKGTCVYLEKKILFAGSIKATVKRIFANDEQMTSGYITETTRMIFRSASAKYFLFIQMSREMWEFDEDGELYFEKAVSNFLPHLFSKWKDEGTNHVVSIVLFTRVFYGTKIDDPLINQAADGRFYKDFYKVLADWETTDDWMSIIGPLKKEQLNFQPTVLLRTEDKKKIVSGQISMAYEGNVLEAVNLALNPFDKHFVDRDLMRTGLSIILITPGVGKFSVNKKLLRLTNERMTDNGIAMDLVCLSPLPLHITPLMVYMDAPQTGEAETLTPTQDTLAPRGGGPGGKPPIFSGNSPERAALMHASTNQKIGYVDPLYRDSNDAPTQKYYAVPHWIDCSFYHHETGRFLKQDKFKTRCKMYELQMMGIMEHDIRGISVPYLSDSVTSNKEVVSTSSSSRTIKQQRSSSSLNDKLKIGEDGSNTNKLSHTSNGETYLSRSANISSSARRPSFFANAEMTQAHPQKSIVSIETPVRNYEKYDGELFKTSPEPRFSKRVIAGPPSSGKANKTNHSSKNSFDSPDRPDANNNPDLWQQNGNTRHKSTTTWHHTSDSRRMTSAISQSQQMGGKGPFESHHLPPRKDDKGGIDPFKSSPTFHGRDDTNSNSRFRSLRRGTVNSTDGKYTSMGAAIGSSNQQQGNTLGHEEDEFTVVSSSTVDPVPINNKGLGNRSDSSRKTMNHSPRQGGVVSGSLPSIHKQSGNSDLMRTSFGATGANNRSSPSHNFSRNNPFKHMLINPCNPSDNQNLFTSHLRRWQHALPKRKDCEGPVVHWKSLATPACLPLTTDYFPSNEELARRYNHYMYTVSASEDTNLYQAGDRNLSEHKKTENLLIEMLSQRLAQGFQIIVDITGSSNYLKPTTVKGDGLISVLGGGFNNIKDGAAAAAVAAAAGKEIENGGGIRAGASPTSNNAATTLATTMTIGGNTKLTTIGANTVPAVANGAAQDDNEKSKWKNMVWWLSMGHQVHQLTFDSSGQNVEVRRYVRMIQFDVGKINYKCAIWPKNMPTYRPKHCVFSYPSLLYAWNYLDHLVAGYQEELTDNLRFWRARFIVIPRETLPTNITLTGALHENLDEEEKRLALFEAWIQNIRKAKWLTPEEREELQKRRKREIGFSDLGIKLTTMDPSAYVASDAMRTAAALQTAAQQESRSSILSSMIIGQGLTRDSRTKEIASALQDSKGGVKIMDRRWHFRMFHDVFTGTEFVDWIIGQIEEITTREQAVQFGNSLMQRKPPLFHSATKRHSFLDGNYFYSLNEEFVIERKKTNKSNNNHGRSRNGHGDTTLGSKETSFDNHTLRQIPSTHSSNTAVAASKERIHFAMSQSMIIDVDPYKKSDRRETAILHYDTIHNPNNCYHFQLNWLGCTAQLVQDLLQNWSRQAERCGLKLVEGSVDQAYEDSENDNPFQCPVPIPMAVPPPSVDELCHMSKIQVPAQFYEIALVRHLGFVLDVEADINFDRAKHEGIDLEYSYIKEVYKYDQYIHQSGVAFVQIRPEKRGFFWVNNRLYTNHTPALIANRRQPSPQLSHPDALRIKFQEHCSDGTWLMEFWESTRTHFLEGLDPDSSDAWVFENSGAIVEMDTGNTGGTVEDDTASIAGASNEKGTGQSPNGGNHTSSSAASSTILDVPVSNGGTTASSSQITVTVSAASPPTPSTNDASSSFMMERTPSANGSSVSPSASGLPQQQQAVNNNSATMSDSTTTTTTTSTTNV